MQPRHHASARSQLAQLTTRLHRLEAAAHASPSFLTIALTALGLYTLSLLPLLLLLLLHALNLSRGYVCTPLSLLLLFASAYFGVRVRSTSQHNLLWKRRMRIYTIAARIFFGFKLAQFRAKHVVASVRQGLWAHVHRQHALMLLDGVHELQGMMVKTGQYISSRPDLVPPVRACSRVSVRGRGR